MVWGKGFKKKQLIFYWHRRIMGSLRELKAWLRLFLIAPVVFLVIIFRKVYFKIKEVEA
jgi:hypothetical protein